MNIWPFKKKGTEKPGELTKEQWLSEAMPLIEVAHVQDRITHYQEGFDALTWSTENRTHDLGVEPDTPVTEHRFVLDLNRIAPARQATVRNAYAMSSGFLKYFPGSNLQAKGWDLENIVGQIPVEQIGAFELSLADSVSTYWMDYYPGKRGGESGEDLELTLVRQSFWYFNIRLDNLDVYIKPLIEKYVEVKFADMVILDSGIPRSGNWVDDYFQVFLTGSGVIPLTGGEAISQIADEDRLSPDGQHFRLSMFFLNGSVSDDVRTAPVFCVQATAAKYHRSAHCPAGRKVHGRSSLDLFIHAVTDRFRARRFCRSGNLQHQGCQSSFGLTLTAIRTASFCRRRHQPSSELSQNQWALISPITALPISDSTIPTNSR